MKHEDCKVGMKISYKNADGKTEYGVIKSLKCDAAEGAVWVDWEDGNTLWIHPDEIDCIDSIDSIDSIEPSLKLSEIYAMLDQILEDSNSTYKDEWYATDHTFTAHGIDKVKEYLKEKYEPVDLKKQALAKLTAEEIKALGIEL